MPAIGIVNVLSEDPCMQTLGQNLPRNGHMISFVDRRRYDLSSGIVENRSSARKIAALVAGVRYTWRATASESSRASIFMSDANGPGAMALTMT